MPKCTACKMDVVTKKSGHQMTGMAVSVCITPAAPSPVPIPYPTMGTVAEGITDPCMRTKIGGAIVMTVGSCMSKCHGNEPGTLKEVVSLNTAGPCFPALGAPIVIMELGMAGITGSIGQMNKSITVGASGSASGAGGGAGGGGAGGGGGGGPGGQGTQGPGGGGGDGGGSNDGAAPPDAPAPPDAEGQATAGHPIDVVTGTLVTVPADDFRLFGPSTLQWVRYYRTSSVRRSCGLGWGWSHSYSWRATRRGNRVEVIDDLGGVTTFALPAGDEVVLAAHGRRLSIDGDDLVMSIGDGNQLVLAHHRADEYVLREVRDPNGNVITVEVDDHGEVHALTDSVGRRLERELLQNGHRWYYLVEKSDGTTTTKHAVSYELDARGDLVRVIDEGGAVFEYVYDEEHYLLEERSPSGMVYHFRYEVGVDAKRRCVETWGEIPGLDVLAEIGHGQRVCPPDVRGLFHTTLTYDPAAGRTTVRDAAGGVHRYDGNELGLVTRYVDPEGRPTTYRYDDLGRLMYFTDALGGRRVNQYDRWGRVVGCVGPTGQRYRLLRDEHGRVTSLDAPGGHRWHMKHDGAGRIVERTNPLGVVETCSYDERGRVVEFSSPRGTILRKYDGHGNLQEHVAANGAVCRYQHDWLGRPTVIEGPNEGRRYEIEYDSYGYPVEVRGPEDGIVQSLPNESGKIVAEAYSAKRTDYRYVGPIPVEATRPDGSTFRVARDAMLRTVWVENAAGDRYYFERDKSGLVTRETTFAGLEYRYEYDAAGQLVRRIKPSGAWHFYHRDLAGWVHMVETSDGQRDRYERDDRGFVVRASNRTTSVTLVRDALGRVIKETQSLGGWKFGAVHEVDATQPGELHRYSTGWSVGIERGYHSSVTRLRLSDEEGHVELIDFEYDDRFMESSRRRASDGGTIQTERDVLGRPTAVTVLGPDGEQLRRRSYRWSRLGLTAVDDELGGRRTYQLDDLGRPVTVKGLGVEETFVYSPHGTPLPQREDCALGPGGRVSRIGGLRYVWDEAGRLVEKMRSDQPEQSWTFRYDSYDRIEKATRGDGYEESYVYDPFGRRIASIGNDGRSTFFGWDASSLVEERRQGRPPKRRVFDSADEYTAWVESPAPGEWRLVASDATGAPWFYLGQDDAHAELELSTWGSVARSQGEPDALRFAGQSADSTGLHYNRHRYYCPEIAQFTTPDPLLTPVMQDVGYVTNPTRFIDPLGLLIIVGVRENRLDDETAGAVAARRRDGEDVVYANELYNPNTGQGRRLDNLPPGERVEIISHGATGAVMFGKNVENGQAVGDKLVKAGLQPGQPVTVLSCNSGTTPNAGHPDRARNQSGQSVVDGIHQATGGANPVTGVSANPGTRAEDLAGVAIVRPGVEGGAPHQRPHAPGPGPGREDGTIDIRDGHFVRAEGGQPASRVDPPADAGDPGP